MKTMRREFKPGADGKNQYAGSWAESPCRPIVLPWSPDSLGTVLRWGLEPEKAPHTHQEIAAWCDRLHIAHLDTDDSADMERTVRIASDVDCQWDLYLANTYSLDELRKLDFAAVRMPLEWFAQWLADLDSSDGGFTEIDPVLQAWASRTEVQVSTRYQDTEVRSVELSGPAGRAQLWVDLDGGITVKVWDYRERRQSFVTDHASLANDLKRALQVARQWCG